MNTLAIVMGVTHIILYTQDKNTIGLGMKACLTNALLSTNQRFNQRNITP